MRILPETIYARSKENSNSGCVEWALGKDKDGYGKLKLKGKSLVAHRASWAAHFGKIPDGIMVLHKCDNPSCVNPEHLFLGTAQDNMTDKMEKGRYRGGPMFWKSSRTPNNMGWTYIGGSKHHNAKLTEASVVEIKKLLAVGERLTRISNIYQVSRVAIARIKNGKAWKHVEMEAA